MAGIGFELKKVFEQRDFGSVFKATIAGVMVVAGPWIVSILSLSIIGVYTGLYYPEYTQLISAIIVYCYAFSLIIFGGFHYLFTRHLSDLIFRKDYRQAAAALVIFLLIAFILSLLVALAASIMLSPGIPATGLFRISVCVLFICVNLIWILMIFASLLTWYGRILAVYLAGMFFAVMLTPQLGAMAGPAGILSAIALGNLFICIALLSLCITAYPPSAFAQAAREGVKSIRPNLPLFAAGLLYFVAVWSDKVIYWFSFGEGIPGTFLYVYNDYDQAFFVANLMIIPGLIIFVAGVEPSYCIHLRKFLSSLVSGTYHDIVRKRTRLFTHTKGDLFRLSSVQLLIMTALYLLFINLVPVFSENPRVFAFTVVGSFFQFMFFCIVNLLFYLEEYVFTMYAGLAYALTNTVLALLTVALGRPDLSGLGFSLAGFLATAIALLRFSVAGRELERLLLSKYS